MAAKSGKALVWVHAVSVGEVLAAAAMVRELQRRWGWWWRCRRLRWRGRGWRRSGLRSVPVFYMPLDFAVVVRRYLGALRPRMVVTDGERALAECDSGV